ncbi:MAG TPA: MgtC/SapB family protein [Anaerolineaceae bacterium]|jgi:putative Mg2+ transporter-C (MgtC) family protein|nr:MgtC/SapB family protein [Anaerolineaceae bacterium]HOR84130.1 MgtC/SapB family protein [Anaerolineaceae bacterium]HOT52588.1 MgtC/SapB family protein [Anaerolineaceae bacterium]HPL42404.1 MgtC/SapB family protein [Anaerolineaceae bacterium]HPY32641.1 MgtC/SapB family protein [Anaerolineaceae bacterium]
MISVGEMLLRLAVSMLLGGAIGFERERDSQPAGLRTHMILILGSCLAMILSINIGIKNGTDPTRMAAQVISGVGFLGAGAILRSGFNVKGLTTATTVWTTAIIGLAVGYGYYWVGVFTTVLVLVVLTLVSIFERKFIRRNILRIVKVDAADNPHIFRNVRKEISRNTDEILSYKTQRSLKSGHVRVEFLIRLDTNEKIEDLMETISKIDGVRNIRIE